MSFWNFVPTHQTTGIASLLSENFQGKIQNIKNENTGRISFISFTFNKQLYDIVSIYGPNKPTYEKTLFNL